jgi:hypothetical protein
VPLPFYSALLRRLLTDDITPTNTAHITIIGTIDHCRQSWWFLAHMLRRLVLSHITRLILDLVGIIRGFRSILGDNTVLDDGFQTEEDIEKDLIYRAIDTLVTHGFRLSNPKNTMELYQIWKGFLVESTLFDNQSHLFEKDDIDGAINKFLGTCQ